MDENAFQGLTTAERNVLRAALGRTNDAVASHLGLSPATVRNQMLSARRKLGSPPRGEACRQFTLWEAAKHKMLKPEPQMPMAPEPLALEKGDAELAMIEDHRTPFDFLDQSKANPTGESTEQILRLIKIVLVLVAVVLTLAALRFLPDLREWAKHVGDGIDPLLKKAGVQRFG